MVRFIPTLVLAVAGGSAEACPSFGFESSHLSQYFCSQIETFADPATRSMAGLDPHGDEALTRPGPEWMALPEIRRAWRSDPAKTLRLIQRIRDAGGRPVQ